MNLKKFFETLRDQIEYGIDNIRASKKYLVSLSLSLVAFLILLIVLFISNSDFSVKKEANILVIYLAENTHKHMITIKV